ncbi:DeoR/GlpR family DNA-binding transcription regulator [Vibrio nitrifigilis]|uniref:DeoR/GlpR transcriptional regulator n=1 Tax=Vibrio nitrifigilis TaxID=2789781 RepID=A0ABS0GCR2_9VIBR|nr:DeoR/GlpR family DNA-binding transcription regulator [Vibrio nitrifigilis]MBF9000198.1 DeoR/GlpR transcriptional regulator [Vibrio nitrifigilis]
MTQEERLIELESYLREHGKVTLEFICERFDISYDSARRDLVKLGTIPGILRIRGGAILNESQIHRSFSQRNEPNPTKQKLAVLAASLIKPSDTVFLDAGTTNMLLAQQLETESTIITNSLESVNALMGKKQIRKCVLGGEFDEFSHTILGNTTVEQIGKYRANLAFIGVSALSDAGITADNENDATLKRAMAEQSAKVILVATSNKFNTQLPYQSCRWQDIDCLITADKPPKNILEKLEQYGVELILLNENK